MPETDTRRIQSIRIRIEEEDYIVNTRQIADKIIDMETALFSCNNRTA